MSLRILLADDHQMFSAGIVALLDKEPDLSVVAVVRDGREAVTATLELEPDVSVIDVSMPGLSGIEATRKIAAARPEIKTLCLSMHRERQYLQAALEAGAAGYVLKDCAIEELLTAIRSVAGGATYLCPEMVVAAVDGFRANLVGHKPAVGQILTGHRKVRSR